MERTIGLAAVLLLVLMFIPQEQVDHVVHTVQSASFVPITQEGGDQTAEAPAPDPQFTTHQGLPYGCPVRPTHGRVVMTQGYGVGSHAPAHIWGGIDLAIDGNGDGFADPGPSWGTPIVATHDGVATVTMGSWPGGNFVSITNGGVRTAYGHLQDVHVTTGQRVVAGEEIGTMGSTGMSSGPHLHYEVWINGVNTDPTNLVGC